MEIDLEKYTLVPFEDDDMDEVFCTPVFRWLERVPVYSYVRYYDKAVFKTPEGAYAAYWEDLGNCWKI